MHEHTYKRCIAVVVALTYFLLLGSTTPDRALTTCSSQHAAVVYSLRDEECKSGAASYSKMYREHEVHFTYASCIETSTDTTHDVLEQPRSRLWRKVGLFN